MVSQQHIHYVVVVVIGLSLTLSASNKIIICHQNKPHKKLNISQNAIQGRYYTHTNDTIPAPINGCPNN